LDSTRVSLLVAALAEAAGEHPIERKLLVCRRYGEGRELLRTLAAARGGWVGFEPTTPSALALEVASVPLAAEGLRVADEFEELALLDGAIDGTLGSAPARLRELAEGVGLRQAIGETVRALRLAGIGADALRRAKLRDREKRDAVARILAAYEAALWQARKVDAAAVFRRALAALDAGHFPSGRIFIVPGHSRRGVAGAFLDELVRRGAVMLRGDAVAGLTLPPGRLRPGRGPAPAPATRLACLHAPERAPAGGNDANPALFSAASVTDELREVLRRIMAAGLRWDEVEIVATEPAAYGAALDSLARRLGIPVTYAVGLPFERTRPGRVVSAWLRWIREDFPEDVIRALLERGDVAPPPGASSATGPALGRRLRRMRIGRGRDRYEEKLAAAEREVVAPVDPAEDRAEEREQRREAERQALAGLAAVLRPVLAATPAVPDRLGVTSPLVEPSALARGLLVLLRLVPTADGVDATAHARLVERLERLAKAPLHATSLAAATAVLLSKLETRVPAPDATGPTPWSSAGGHLHLTDIAHGGFTGRPATFVVGLDAGRFPGAGVQDALLTDEDRRALGTGGDALLPTTAERLEEKRYALAELLARLRGRVTLSYSAWDAAETRMVPPAAEMLQAFRLVTGDPLATYESLHEALPRASAVPRGAGAIDGADVWLRALSHDGILRFGENVVREVFRPLDRGLRAKVARDRRELTTHHGRIGARERLDPRRNPELVVSASRLEALGTCPRRYMLRYVLGIWPPDDPDMQPDRWLSPLDRGSLLHAVYERALQFARDQHCGVQEQAFERIALDVLDREVAYWRQAVPPPGRAVYDVEVAGLREDLLSFVQMVRGAAGEWIALERRFGRDAEEPVELVVPGGPIRIAGAIDRVDRLKDGGLVIIDYKTGSPYGYSRRTGLYNGGRRLQHVLYAAVATKLFGEPVVRAEYHFPTVKGKNHPAPYDVAELSGGFEVVDRLLDLVARGHFHPTDDPDDCKFCDYAVVCRADAGGSPPASWAKQATEVEELHVMRELRAGP
jgi:ATP-dependent helicase/nuclease subunit B